MPIAALGLAVTVLGGCNPGPDRSVDSEVSQRVAIAQLSPTEGNKVSGTVTFIEDRDGVRVVADLIGLPSGMHGFHIHENGDCSAPDASSAGGHFNPTNAKHAGPDSRVRHVGDLGNIEATSAGQAQRDTVDSVLTFEGPNSIIGKGVIVHAGKDDLTSQPSGAAGARLACGVIEWSDKG
ncbi:superoxide dismutase family protein [Pelagicoccus sp. SDUM812002]|uniref:superoxide dismutase family protein n=1 Tax=Pelagicoccus sp. SDUM812002 TaxID=3041266 RepID=UPI00280F4D17|nr:superoxide dismutase family protein [Pelagicoccus sp. SDUM812002]MDQ8184097.1 superoxide dismutase family protein [Pelagicoccus sp. SDUM812002]